MYADGCCEIGKELGVPVLDLWSVFMAEAGWREGEPLAGSLKTGRNNVLGELLHDGMLPSFQRVRNLATNLV